MKKQKKIIFIAVVICLLILAVISAYFLGKKQHEEKIITKNETETKTDIKTEDKKKSFDELSDEQWKQAEQENKEEEILKERKKRIQSHTIDYDEYKKIEVKFHYPEGIVQYDDPVIFALTLYKKEHNASFTDALYLADAGVEDGVRYLYVQVNDEDKTILLLSIDKNELAECTYPTKSQDEIKEFIASIGEEGEDIESIQKNIK